MLKLYASKRIITVDHDTIYGRIDININLHNFRGSEFILARYIRNNIVINTFAMHRYDSGSFREPGVILLITYICVNKLITILSIVVDYPYICFICVQVNMCNILHKRKTCCKKGRRFF